MFICHLLENPLKQIGKSIEATQFTEMFGFRDKYMYMPWKGLWVQVTTELKPDVTEANG